MSWFHANTAAADARDHASAAEIVACFRDQRDLLERLAFLITADEAIAEQSVVQACELTLKGNSPFRAWLLEWAKAATITAATSIQGGAIRLCEARYKDRRCGHAEHLSQFDDDRRAASLAFILQIDTTKIIADLDALCRAILVLRIAIRSSVQDCCLRLNVSRPVAVAANCLAMTWLERHLIKPSEDEREVSHYPLESLQSSSCTLHLHDLEASLDSRIGGSHDDRSR